jgi:hypothetical protein
MATDRDALQIYVAGGEALLTLDYSGKWGVGKGTVKLNLRDIFIDGMTVPKFTWGWVGLSIAAGLLSGVGSLALSVISNALFTNKGKNMEQYLQELLEQFQQIIREELHINDLRNYVAAEKSYSELFRLYSESHSMATLNYLMNEPPKTFYQLDSLGYYGYRPFMILAGLRLAIVQEYIRRTGKGQQHFEEIRQAAIAHHQDVGQIINHESHPTTLAGGAIGKWEGIDVDPPEFEPGDIVRFVQVNNRRVLSETLDGLLVVSQRKLERGDETAELSLDQIQRILDRNARTGRYYDQFRQAVSGKVASLSAIRKKLKAENVDQGEKMIPRWAHAKTTFQRVA